ncbi:MAG: DUF2726 domain-containing protein [Clostridia bacterium]|nr:DUF2726 domain-containing protein [Clostridia bacterium]
MEEKREIIQEKIYDENGNLKYTIIPNYKKVDNFMTENEIKFYKYLITELQKIQKKYNLKLQVFPQVAINRIIKQNNRREKELKKNLFARSIDFMIYDLEKDDIFCCIELDGKDHETEERKKTDINLNEAFKSAKIRLIRQEIKTHYEENEIINKLIKKQN